MKATKGRGRSLLLLFAWFANGSSSKWELSVQSAHFGRRNFQPSAFVVDSALFLRGGSSQDDEEPENIDADTERDLNEIYNDEGDSADEESERTEDEFEADVLTYDRDDDDEEVIEEVEDDNSEVLDPIDVSGSSANAGGEFLEPYVMPPSINMYTFMGAYLLGQRLDLFNPTIVRLIRFAFIIQIVVQQLFVIYVRVTAKKNSDRTKIEVGNPVSGLLSSQFAKQEEESSMIKGMMSAFLSTETTIMEYDMNQAASMQIRVISLMLVQWVLHFKLNKVQPLLIQVVTGFLQLIYHPLFQIYVLGRKLERPFKSQAMAVQNNQQAAEEDTGNQDDSEPDEVGDQGGEDEDSAVGEDDDLVVAEVYSE